MERRLIEEALLWATGERGPKCQANFEEDARYVYPKRLEGIIKLLEEFLHGEGENQHDLPGCEEEAGPNWKGEGEKGEDYTTPEDFFRMKKPSPTPTREDRRIQLEALITERCGMVAENMQRRTCGQSMAYSDKDFNEVAENMRRLLSMPCVPKE